MIVVIDYGMGNLGSVANMLRKVNADVTVSADPGVIAAADKLVLPGVGAFGKGMENLERSGLLPVLHQKVRVDRTPILGICLGMQLFTRRSEEGMAEGLGWLDAEVVRFRFDEDSPLKVPHMGWNTVTLKRPSLFWEDGASQSRYYFVHSYYVRCGNSEDVLTTTHHGWEFVSAVQSGNVVGVQFHPEKSHQFGMRFVGRFVDAF